MAMPELPINKDTLKYGSGNLSGTVPKVLNEDPKIARKMRKASQLLNIKEHFTGAELGPKVKLYSPIGKFLN